MAIANLEQRLEQIEGVLNCRALGVSHTLVSMYWPVGSAYLAFVSTDPATLLGCGTWTLERENTSIVPGSTVYIWKRTA